MKDLDKRLNEIQAELTELRKMVEPKPQGSFVTDSEKADDIHDALKYLHLLPEGYCFCDEADAERWIKVEMMPGRGEQHDLGIVLETHPKLGKQFYRPICKIQPGKHPKSNERTSRIFNSAIDSPQVRTDYSHLLPEGYEFCKEEEAESLVKVEKINVVWHQANIGEVSGINDIDDKYKSYYRPIRKIQQPSSGYVTCTRKGIVPESEIPEGLKKLMQEAKSNPYQVDWSNAPEWADSHAFDVDSMGYWYGALAEFGYWDCISENSTFTLPSGLDWKQSKTRRVN